MEKDYHNLFKNQSFPQQNLEEKRKRHNMDIVSIGRDLLGAEVKNALEQMKR